MSNYYVLPIESEEHGFIWCVMENSGNQNKLIQAYPFEDDATDHMKFLSKGGGFDGWTPSFVLNSVAGFKVEYSDNDESDEDYNEEFDEEFA